MLRNGIDLVLLAAVLVGGVLSWQAGQERSHLATQHARLVAAAGELPVDDPTLVYLKALDTGDPLHFAWRVHLPAKTHLDFRCRRANGSTAGSWVCSTPTDFIARVRFRVDDQGVVDVYTRFLGASSRSGGGNPGLARLLREHARELKVEQVGASGVAAFDPTEKKPRVLLRVVLPDSLRRKPPPDLSAHFLQYLVELRVGPPGSLP